MDPYLIAAQRFKDFRGARGVHLAAPFRRSNGSSFQPLREMGNQWDEQLVTCQFYWGYIYKYIYILYIYKYIYICLYNGIVKNHTFVSESKQWEITND